MAVPNCPAAGAVVETAWGQVAHDTAVAQDIQRGTVIVTTSGSPPTGSTVVTFPRPFAAGPAVMVMPSAQGGDQCYVGVDSVNATSCRVGLRAASPFGYTVQWIAIGPRA